MKKKIFMLSLVACLVVLSIAGTSLAYFTDIHEKSNVFTSGKVDITLTYDVLENRVYPGQTYTTDAVITNVGNEDAYVGIIIDVATTVELDVDSVFTVEGASDVKYVEVEGGYTIFAVVENDVDKKVDDETVYDVTLSVNMIIPATWTSEQTAEFTGANPLVTVTAYGVQTVGFGTAADALTAAFPIWAGYTTDNQ